MRNRRLLTLAVLAVAIGFAAYAQAADYGTAVVTLIKDPTGSPNTFDVSVRLWDDAGVGVDVVAADTPGLLDFVIKGVRGPEGVGVLKVTGMTVQAPWGTVTDGNDWFGGMASNTVAGKKIGIRYAGYSLADANTYWAVGLQPAAYSGAGTPSDLRDAGILLGIGTAPRAANDANTQNGYGTWSTPPAGFAADTKVASGTYTAGSGGDLTLTTYGPDSFARLPALVGGKITGPITDPNMYKNYRVKNVIIQTTTGAGNSGGIALANPVTLKVEYGNVVLGSQYASDANTIVKVTDANTSVTMRGTASPRVLGGLTITTATAGYQGVNANATRIDIYDADPVGTASTLKGLVTAYAGAATEGLYSSQLTVGDANEVLVVTAVDTSATPDGIYELASIKATLIGDVNLDGTVGPADYVQMFKNWTKAKNQWYDGDITGDGSVGPADYVAMFKQWTKSFVPDAPGAVPEPATMSLLCLGALGLLRRRRRI